MVITLYCCLLLISRTPAFLVAAIPPESVYLHALTPPDFIAVLPPSEAGFAELAPRHWCDPTYESNGALRALLDPLHVESARKYCSTYIPALTGVTVTDVAAEVTTTIAITLSAEAPSVTPFTRQTFTNILTSTEWTTQTITDGRRIYTNYVPGEGLFAKRAEPVPSFVSEYPPSQISEACSCIVSPITTTTTSTPLVTTTLTATPEPEPIQPQQIEPETITTIVTVTETATVTTAATPLPTLCDPKHFKSYHGASDTRHGKLVGLDLYTKEDCCLACYRTPNCIFWLIGFLEGEESKCQLRVITEDNGLNLDEDPIEFLIPFIQRKDLCPLGVETASSMVWPGSKFGAEYGPCLAKSPLVRDDDDDDDDDENVEDDE